VCTVVSGGEEGISYRCGVGLGVSDGGSCVGGLMC